MFKIKIKRKKKSKPSLVESGRVELSREGRSGLNRRLRGWSMVILSWSRLLVVVVRVSCACAQCTAWVGHTNHSPLAMGPAHLPFLVYKPTTEAFVGTQPQKRKLVD